MNDYERVANVIRYLDQHHTEQPELADLALGGRRPLIHHRPVRHEAQAHTHLRIGRVLASRSNPEDFEETIFDVVNHLNRGAESFAGDAGRRSNRGSREWMRGCRSGARCASPCPTDARLTENDQFA